MTSFDVMGWWSDARFALRGMRQWPLAVCVAVATLAIGIGANTALFSVIDAVVLRPLPVAEPSRLVKLIQTEKSEGGRYAVAYHNFHQWRARSESLAAIALIQRTDVGVGDSQTVERVPGYRVSSGYFETLGQRPAVGRVFSEDAYSLGTPIPEVIVSDTRWRDHFDRAPDVLSQSLRIDGVLHSIVGVMPPPSPIESLGSASKASSSVSLLAVSVCPCRWSPSVFFMGEFPGQGTPGARIAGVRRPLPCTV